MFRMTRKSFFVLLLIVLTGTLCGLTIGLVVAVSHELPQIQDLENFEPGAASRIMSSDGQLIAELYQEKRLPLPLSDLPTELQHAFIAIEDRRFYRHPGLDLIRNFGALLRDLRAGSYVEGASTITQQLAKNLFLTSEKTLARKLKEVFLALQIERRYTKQEILKLYLNQIYLGAGNYGVGAAASFYFDKKVSELTLAECALLAGLPKSPERYQPFKHPQRALSRRRIVLSSMVRDGYISQEKADRAAREPMKLAARQAGKRARHFVLYVANTLVSLFGQNAVYRGGLTVETTLNWGLQSIAEEVLKTRLAQLSAERETTSSTGEELQGALVVLEVGSGAILSWAAGSNYKEASFDHIREKLLQPGSAIKPLIYALAVESGMTQADRIWDAPITYRLPDRTEPWQPQNFSRRFEGEITLRRALEVSGNIPAIKLLSRVGIDNFITLARNLGLRQPLTRDLTLALGPSPMSLLELTGAYNALAGRGLWIQPYAISAVKDRSGRIIHRTAPDRQAALTPETAFIITDMLKGVVSRGTAQRAAVLKRPLAGVPGTGAERREALFIGYSPEITTGIWVGYKSEQPLEQGWSGARTALPVWIDFMRQALQDKPAQDFERPAGVILAPMDRFTGLQVKDGHPNCVWAAFREKALPRKE